MTFSRAWRNTKVQRNATTGTGVLIFGLLRCTCDKVRAGIALWAFEAALFRINHVLSTCHMLQTDPFG